MALKILLADDSMTAQNMGKKILVDAGYEVVAVSNGAAAIKKISSERPDIAILDEYMPGYTGSEVCERVKASAETSKIPVLLTVGKMEPFDQQKANKVRADGVMIKPFEASDLIAAIQSIAQRLLTATPAPRTGYDSTAPRTVQSEPDHEDTLRLTPEQIKEVQDASYRDWADTAERGTEEDGESPAEMDVTPAIDAPVSVELAIPVAESEPAAFAAAILEPEAAIPVQETPVFSAITASGVAAEHEIFISPTTPVASVGEPAPVSTDAALYTPPSIENAVEAETPAFIVQPEPVTPAVIEPTLTDEPEIVTPVLEPIVEAIAEPAAEAAPVMAESALVLLDQAVVVQPDLEPTLAPVVEVSSAPAHGLEVNSPPQEGGAPEIAPDAALVTEAEDMTQFATSFGAQDAEPVHVGVAADLPDTQLAAIVTPAESESSATIEEPAVETPAVGLSVTSAVTEEPLVVTEPVIAEEIEAAAPSEPVVEDPSLAETQTFIAVPEPEPVVEPVAPEIDEPVVAEVAPEIEPESVIAEPEITAEPAASEPVVTHEPEPSHIPEIAVAAAATAAAVDIPHVFSHVAALGDPGLAKDLAAALASNEAGEPDQPAVETVAEAEPASEEVAATFAELEGHGVSDSKLAEAVARAFEHLKPQLITEIIKELGK